MRRLALLALLCSACDFAVDGLPSQPPGASASAPSATSTSSSAPPAPSSAPPAPGPTDDGGTPAPSPDLAQAPDLSTPTKGGGGGD